MYSVDITNTEKGAFKVNSEGYEFIVGGKDQGASPPGTLLAGLGTCLGVYIRKYSESAGLGLKDFGIKVQADFVKEPKVHFKDINVSIDFKGASIDERRKGAILNFIKNCPVHNTLKASPNININLL